MVQALPRLSRWRFATGIANRPGIGRPATSICPIANQKPRSSLLSAFRRSRSDCWKQMFACLFPLWSRRRDARRASKHHGRFAMAVIRVLQYYSDVRSEFWPPQPGHP